MEFKLNVWTYVVADLDTRAPETSHPYAGIRPDFKGVTRVAIQQGNAGVDTIVGGPAKILTRDGSADYAVLENPSLVQSIRSQ
jgi:hypothetical protein